MDYSRSGGVTFEKKVKVFREAQIEERRPTNSQTHLFFY
jgi:hypothetical protein